MKLRIKKLGITYIDGNDVFSNERYQKIGPVYDNGKVFGHYTPRGYSLIAKAMLEEINGDLE